MAYNHDISMANIVNVVEALNEGGMLSCDDLMRRLWNNATGEQQARKISAPRNSALHVEAYALKQVRQEVRRTLYNYFNDVDESPYDIYRAHAHGDAERFWVAEPQDFSVDIIGEESDVTIVVNQEVENTPAAANLYEALTAAREQINEEFVGLPNTPEVRGRLNTRIESIIEELGVAHV